MLQFCLAIFMIPAYYINDPIIKDKNLFKGRLSFKIVRTEMKCDICGKVGKGPNMKRYHFNNCKSKGK